MWQINHFINFQYENLIQSFSKQDKTNNDEVIAIILSFNICT